MLIGKPEPLRRYIICGGRDFNDWQYLADKLSVLLERDWNFVLVHGAAPGADRMAGVWGDFHNVVVEPHPAQWEKLGRRAGMVRNREMLNTGVNGVVAFPGGVGTAGMVGIARTAGVPVWDLRNKPN